MTDTAARRDQTQVAFRVGDGIDISLQRGLDAGYLDVVIGRHDLSERLRVWINGQIWYIGPDPDPPPPPHGWMDGGRPRQ